MLYKILCAGVVSDIDYYTVAKFQIHCTSTNYDGIMGVRIIKKCPGANVRILTVRLQMSPILYSACSKPILGAVLWLSGYCSIPALLPPVPVDFSKPGQILIAEFEAPEYPVPIRYFLYLNHTFPSLEDRLADTLVGAQYDFECYGPKAKKIEDFNESQQKSLGKPIRLHIRISKIADKQIIVNRTYASICRAGHDLKSTKHQIIDLVELPKGRYRIEVENEAARPDFDKIKSAFMIGGHTGK
ncbi:MAG: hypothetical protein KJ958_15215 [Gammaproteobacteria bacterium]|nr:hypothetical protein [Gammaproteobacteria bacterium]MBU1980508.1 hypothetical protein [Gammaproteobacteria bacterium]